MNKNIKNLIILTAILIIFSALNNSVVYAIAVESFGGRIKEEHYCAKPPAGKMLNIKGPKGGIFYYDANLARTYLYGEPKSDRWTIGLSSGMFACELADKRIMAGKIIRIIGTSRF